MLQAAQCVDDFEIIRLLGKGGMGEVYEAQQLHPSRRVALKVLAPWLSQDEDALLRFRREVEVLAQLDHPGIVHVITTGKTPDGLAFYTMKLIRGVSLAELIKVAAQPPSPACLAPTKSQAQSEQETPTGAGVIASNLIENSDGPPDDVVREYLENRFGFIVRVGIAAARALSAAHDQGHLHRDIKPSNLMIDHHGQLYLVDFGLTRALDAGADVSRAGAVRGTPWYMSPEQASGATIDQRSDIYSLGVTLYMLATKGTGPFTANRDDSNSVLEQVRSGMHLPLRVLAPEIPHNLEQVILRAIQLKPKRRFPNAAEFAAALEVLLPSASGMLTPSKPRSVVVVHKRWRRVASLLVAAILVIAASIELFRATNNRRHATNATLPNASNPSLATVATQPQPESKPQPQDDYPAMLRNPPPRTAVPLLRDDFKPIWSFPNLLGDGDYHGLPTELLLRSLTGSNATMIALADSSRTDAKQPWFEFAVELRRSGVNAGNEPGGARSGELGIFWGCQSPSIVDSGRVRFFVARLDKLPASTKTQTQLVIGTSLLDLSDARGGVSNWCRPLANGRGILRNANVAADTMDWHRIRLRVQDHKTRITLDDGAFQEFETSWLADSDPWLKDGILDPRGMMGVWTNHAVGAFRNATFMALP